MNTENIKNFLNLASQNYYAGTPIISDDQFDSLADTIKYTEVGYKPIDSVKHFHRMWSLQKYYEDEARTPIPGKYSKSPKIDGAAISILYVQGEFVRALTRGDGIEGKVITNKFLATNLIPKNIDTKHSILQITGEVAAPKHVENARNYAAGALNLGDVDEFRTRAVTFFAYGVYPYIEDTFDGDMLYLQNQGFNTVKDPEIHNIYPTDGIVFRLNSNKQFDEAGYTAKHPKGAYALKERAETVETRLLSVEWQVGKSGKVTPVAILEPVVIKGATISRATLNNPGFIQALDLRIGDIVAVRRSGEIIPQIVHKVE